MLDWPVTKLKGFGERKAQRLKKLGISTVEDLLLQYPNRYIDRRALKRISEIEPDIPVVVELTILGQRLKPKMKGLRQSDDFSVFRKIITQAISFFLIQSIYKIALNREKNIGSLERLSVMVHILKCFSQSLRI